MLGEDSPQLIRGRGARLDQRHPRANKSSEFTGGLSHRLNPAQPVDISPGVVGQHERVSGIRFCAGQSPPRPRCLERRRFDHQHRMTSTGDQSNDQTLPAFDRDWYRRWVADRVELGKQRRQRQLGMLNHPGPDHPTCIIDEANTVLGRTPIPSAEHPLTSRQDIATGAGRPSGPHCSALSGAALLRRSCRPTTTRATSSNRPSSG